MTAPLHSRLFEYGRRPVVKPGPAHAKSRDAPSLQVTRPKHFRALRASRLRGGERGVHQPEPGVLPVGKRHLQRQTHEPAME